MWEYETCTPTVYKMAEQNVVLWECNDCWISSKWKLWGSIWSFPANAVGKCEAWLHNLHKPSQCMCKPSSSYTRTVVTHTNCQCWIGGSCPCWECGYHHVCQVWQHTGCLKGLWQHESLRCNLMDCNEWGICWVQTTWKNIGSIWTNAELVCQAWYDDLHWPL